MKLGIIGLAGAGKTTIFEALTQNKADAASRGESRIGTIRVPDHRVVVLSDMYKPRKTVYAQVEYFLPGMVDQKKDQNLLNQVRDCDALIHVVRNFTGYNSEQTDVYKDFFNIDEEMIITDMAVVENKLERIELDMKRGKKTDPEEISLLKACLENLENGIPLRKCPELANARQLKGYAFVTAKPMLVLFNNEDEDDKPPEKDNQVFDETSMVIKGKLEHELSQMSIEEAADFLEAFSITESAMDRVIRQSYELLGLISFFTVGEDEVRAWTIKTGTKAVDAAGVVHSDMQKGFIRAEVLAYDDLMEAGSFQGARKKGTVRLEGKTYDVNDGDIINFRFNV